MERAEIALTLGVVHELRINVADKKAHADPEPNVSRLGGIQCQAQVPVDFRGGGDLVVSRWTVDVEKPVRDGAADDLAIDFDGGLDRRSENRRAVDIDSAAIGGKARNRTAHLRETRAACASGHRAAEGDQCALLDNSLETIHDAPSLFPGSARSSMTSRNTRLHQSLSRKSIETGGSAGVNDLSTGKKNPTTF